MNQCSCRNDFRQSTQNTESCNGHLLDKAPRSRSHLQLSRRRAIWDRRLLPSVPIARPGANQTPPGHRGSIVPRWKRDASWIILTRSGLAALAGASPVANLSRPLSGEPPIGAAMFYRHFFAVCGRAGGTAMGLGWPTGAPPWTRGVGRLLYRRARIMYEQKTPGVWV
jgi:hypothetical protein